jgi:hypothetical protein
MLLTRLQHTIHWKMHLNCREMKTESVTELIQPLQVYVVCPLFEMLVARNDLDFRFSSICTYIVRYLEDGFQI